MPLSGAHFIGRRSGLLSLALSLLVEAKWPWQAPPPPPPAAASKEIILPIAFETLVAVIACWVLTALIYTLMGQSQNAPDSNVSKYLVKQLPTRERRKLIKMLEEEESLPEDINGEPALGALPSPGRAASPSCSSPPSRAVTPSGGAQVVRWTTDLTIEAMLKFETVIFDCDGVLWGIPSEETEKSVAVVNYLLTNARRVMFITNNSNKTRHDFLLELERKGVHFGNISMEEKLHMMLSAARTTATYLKEHEYKRPFVLTSDTGLLDELKEVGIFDFYATADELGLIRPEFEAMTQDRDVGEKIVKAHLTGIDCVVVGWDTGLNARKVATAVNLLAWHDELYPDEPKLPLIACSGDASGVLGTVLYGEPERPCKVRAIGNGAMADLIARCFDPPREWLDMGKPSDALLEMLKSADGYNVDLTSALMVGDTLQTDIRFGVKGGMQTLLVLSGVSSLSDAEAALQAREAVPHYVLPSLGILVEKSPELNKFASETRHARARGASLNNAFGMAASDVPQQRVQDHTVAEAARGISAPWQALLKRQSKSKIALNKLMEKSNIQPLQQKRRQLLRLEAAQSTLRRDISSLQFKRISSRTDYLVPLVELIGEPPARPWENEWVPLNVEFYRMMNEMDKATEEWVRHKGKLQDWKANREDRIGNMVFREWDRKDAEVYMCLGGRTAAMAAAMSAEDDHLEDRSRYAASTYALSQALFATAKHMDRVRKRALHKAQKKREEAQKRIEELEESASLAPASLAPASLAPSRITSGAVAGGSLAPSRMASRASGADPDGSETPLAPIRVGTSTTTSRRPSLNAEDSSLIPEEELPEFCRLPQMLYWHRSGPYSLESVDPKWAELEIADEFGFCGLTSMAMVKGTCDEHNFQVDADGVCRGYTMRVQFTDADATYETHECDVIGFESQRTDDNGMHAAVLCESYERGAFPPITLFRLKKILKPGEWEAPGGAKPKQRLLVVTATYHEPTFLGKNTEAKLFGHTITLEYALRDAYIKGLGQAFSRPICSMQDEFDRDLSWKDWQDEHHNLKACWEYVNGVAKAKHTKYPGMRDQHNDGLKLADFVDRVNEHIKKRRDAMKDKRTFNKLPDEHAYLTNEEVLAVRLYSGPAFQPINDFVRQVSKTSGEFREELVNCAHITFAATVTHICNAIRKLADVNAAEDLEGPLYRCVRGVLPNSIWASEESDVVTVVDTAFMSTSRSRENAMSYLSSYTRNVMWVLQPKQESDSAFHCGASIKLISQFAFEDEVLFPPNTMIRFITRKQESILSPVSDSSMSPRRASAPSPKIRSIPEMVDRVKLHSEGSLHTDELDEWKEQRMRRFQVSYEKHPKKDGQVASFLCVQAVPSFV